VKQAIRHSFCAVLFLALAACGNGCGGAKGHTDQSKVLVVNAEVPALVRVDHRGQVVSLRGAPPTLLYFYPKDGTPGCTKEACAFRDAWQKYEQAGLRVVGVSIDDEKSHREFAEEHQLQFSLIADPEHTWSDAFGVGRFLGTADERVSFLIDAAGKVKKVYEDVDPGVHADEVLADARALGLAK
jgi:peroxiredoxin Q/BCP